MRKILFITLVTSFISLESQAEDKLCRVLTLDVILMDTNDTFLQCRQGDTLMIVENFVPRERTREAIISMNYICKEGTIQILRDDTVEDEKLKDRKDFIATCELASLNKRKTTRGF